jgi:ubiquinone/menaquinone biosynthesis C-methylase UbiE
LNIPIDDIGYFDAKKLLKMDDLEFLSIMEKLENNRYSLSGYRNYSNYWKLYSGVETERNKTILDFGCGSAWLSELLVRQGFRTMSFDIHDDLERIIRLRKAADIRLDAKNWEFIQGDAHDMPFANSCFSQVCCYDSLHHMHDYLKVFKEFYRVTKKGGRIIFVEPGARHSDWDVGHDTKLVRRARVRSQGPRH